MPLESAGALPLSESCGWTVRTKDLILPLVSGPQVMNHGVDWLLGQSFSPPSLLISTGLVGTYRLGGDTQLPGGWCSDGALGKRDCIR